MMRHAAATGTLAAAPSALLPLSEGDLLRFDFVPPPLAPTPRRRAERASSIREAIVRWLDQQL